MSFSSKCLLLFALTFLISLSVLSLKHKGLTFDEKHHFLYGLNILKGDSHRSSVFDNSVMPFSALNAFFTHQQDDLDSRVKNGRYVTIFFLALLALIVFCWSKELYGTVPALFSLFLFCLDPNIIAHGHLVTTDLYAAFSITAALYFYWRFLKYGGYARALISAVALGISQIAKYFSVFLYPLFLVMMVLWFLSDIMSSWKQKDFAALKNMARSCIKYILIFLFINLLVINIGFCFLRPFVPLQNYFFQSHTFQLIQKVPVLHSIPLPVPYPFVQGMDLCKYAEQTGQSFGPNYLLGVLHRNGTGFKGYFLIAMFFKLPLAALFIILISLLVYFHRYHHYVFVHKEMFLLLPALFYLIFFNLFININIGIRYILFIFPLFYIFCGSLFVFWDQYPVWIKRSYLLLMVSIALSVLSFYPYYLGYFNEFIGDRKLAYKILADSNLDWGGDEWFLHNYLEKHPKAILTPSRPVAGRIIVSVNDLTGVSGNWKRFRWLRDNFKPDDQIASSFLVYDITKEDLRRIHVSK